MARIHLPSRQSTQPTLLTCFSKLKGNLLLTPYASAILRIMSIRNAGGDWEPMLLGIEARQCKVCKEELYRNKTFLSGGWSRCALCEDFVHYSCLASGKVSFLKARPRVCKICRTAQESTPSSPPKPAIPVAVGS